MILLLRVFLVGLIIYLLLRAFYIYGEEKDEGDKTSQKPGKPDPRPVKKISKDTGEYIDYEEVK